MSDAQRAAARAPGTEWWRSALAPAAIVVVVMIGIFVVQIALSGGGGDECATVPTFGERATTPEAAFDRWWSDGGQVELGELVPERSAPSTVEVVRVGERTWRWDTFGEEYVEIRLSRRPGTDSYFVDVLARCS